MLRAFFLNFYSVAVFLHGVTYLEGCMKPFTSLNRKLLWSVLVSSSIITTIITLASLYTEYNGEIMQQNRNIEYLEDSFIPSIELSMWTLDRLQTLSQIKGLLASRDIFRVLIHDKDRIFFDEAKEKMGEHGNFEKKYQLIYASDAAEVSLGELTIFVTKDAIYDRLLS